MEKTQFQKLIADVKEFQGVIEEFNKVLNNESRRSNSNDINNLLDKGASLSKTILDEFQQLNKLVSKNIMLGKLKIDFRKLLLKFQDAEHKMLNFKKQDLERLSKSNSMNSKREESFNDLKKVRDISYSNAEPLQEEQSVREFTNLLLETQRDIKKLESVAWETNQHLNDISITVYQDDIISEKPSNFESNTIKSNSDRGIVQLLFKKKKYCIGFLIILLILALAIILSLVFLLKR